MSYKAGDWVIVRSLETICEENGRSNDEAFYTRDGIRFNKEKAAYCGRLMLVGQVHTTAGFTGYRLIDPMTDLVVCYKNDVQMLFSDTLLYTAVPASELSVAVDSSVWVRPWNEIIAQANPPARLDDPYCRVNTIYINRSMKKMCLKKYQIIHINYDRYGDTTAAKLRDEDGTIWNFPLSTLYCCSEFVQSIITQPTVSFEEIFGKDE